MSALDCTRACLSALSYTASCTNSTAYCASSVTVFSAPIWFALQASNFRLINST
ncbi:hypothetical protein COCC4DRAFT_32365 [Bipolaris maydis ATCC 48331]|uniref:Uncharacterized protein n=2 Tax=Cochliobolus heterostrophus TaxID=5016 RepID=M2UGZ8_COCH5|nr:uncharacterized protein COCC4DRAFT_32365 [Bipolaris maydis ATCC 48331]EMD92951.1 hypothetical protein COCHEDRAFT_1020820 [Bipolaris maydis C5]ENI04663.1 hypothetical protein COCC4DRAFT_32365 [Bipolaris maydis ATCC 48331]